MSNNNNNNNNNNDGGTSTTSTTTNTTRSNSAPLPGRRNILITSALPYVNNVPHLGNIIGCVLSADVFSRYVKMRGHNAIYICGTDEYGTATETKALQDKCTPQQLCDKYFPIHAKIYDWFDIDFDKFGRTSTDAQTEVTQDIFKKLYENGYITEEEMDQLYCPSCCLFLADRFVEGTCPHCAYDDARGDQCDSCQKLLNPTELKKPRCKVDRTTPILKSTKHLFLDLPSLFVPLSSWYEGAAEKGEWSSNAVQITKTWIKPEGLKKRCITRDLKWGTPVPLPGYEDKVFYVWFDACIGYISITATYTTEWKKWWMSPNDVELFQFMGKDNVPFHTVIFPATLLGTSEPYTMLHHVSTTEFLNYEDGKFSKSRGTGVFGDAAISSGIPSEIWRYYLLANRPEQADSTFSWDDFMAKSNSELKDNLGNFVNRGLKFVSQFFANTIPEYELNEEDKEFIKQINEQITKYNHALEKVRLKDGLKEVMFISALGNKYIQDNKPWQLIKENNEIRCASVVFVSVNLVKCLAALMEPFLPSLSKKILAQLQSPHDHISDTFEFKMKPGHVVGTIEPLINPLSKASIDEFKVRFGGSPSSTTSSISSCSISSNNNNNSASASGSASGTPFPAEIRVGKIIEVENHQAADHLYVLKIDLGSDRGVRQIVSGLRGAYRDKALLEGKKLIVLCNLKESKFKGVISQGMVLTAEAEGQIQILTVDEEVTLGSLVLPSGFHLSAKPKYSVDDFKKLNFKVKDGMIYYIILLLICYFFLNDFSFILF
eukprot:TRINITY_DN1602_c0_g2_i2.p1 TRINITY_DN1602_c0_g2~~TRINITY_DN1602_c0_g2_i2.p1  ORF type:complete len:774 (-),score=199.10 TRINITY_DN1602_c0_g2_i2:89-2410(-)